MIYYKWDNWFAWHPIAFGPHIAWLKTVQRRRDDNGETWYRLLPKGREEWTSNVNQTANEAQEKDKNDHNN